LSRAVVYRSLGAAWEKFLAARARQDPEGRFLNEYFRELMSSNVPEMAGVGR
jgi:hypothetical protein